MWPRAGCLRPRCCFRKNCTLTMANIEWNCFTSEWHILTATHLPGFQKSESCSAAMRASTGLTTTSAMATSRNGSQHLDAAKKLGAKFVRPGHGARGDGGVLDNQQQFFRELRERVGKLVQAKKTPREIYSSIEGIRGELKSQSPIARYVGDGLAAQVEKVHQEMTGKPFPPEVKAAKSARLRHAHDHSLQLA